MKVSVIGLRGIPNIMGGVETHCEELMPRIVANNPDIAIQVIGRRPYILHDFEYKGVDVTSVYAPAGKHSEAIVATFLSILKARRSGADAVHIHAIGPAVLTPLARLLGMRVLLTHHGEDFQRAKWNFVAKVALRLGETLGMRFANKIVAVSPSLHRNLRVRYPGSAGRTAYIPNGMSQLARDNIDDQAVLESFGLAKKGFFLVAARLVPEKGIDYLIDAHRLSGSDRILVIAGASMHGSTYSEKLRKSAGPNVLFTDKVPRKTLASLYRNAALFILPSYHEGLPISALEALSLGASVLLSDIDANIDLGLPERHYFPVGQSEALASRLKSADFSDLETSNWDGASAFNWDAIADRTANCYRELG